VLKTPLFGISTDVDPVWRNAVGDPHLCLDGVGCVAIKSFDSKMLLDPFEKQFDLPADGL
jgi:hypothetical protein